MTGGRRLSSQEQSQLNDIERHLQADLDFADSFTAPPDPGDPGLRGPLLAFGALIAGLGLLIDSPLLAFIAMVGSAAAATVPGLRGKLPNDADHRADPMTPAT